MTVPRPIPLYPPLDLLNAMKPNDFPELYEFLESGPEWQHERWAQGQEFLLYIGRTKSAHTFLRFRSELEKFFLWCFQVRGEDPLSFKKSDVLDYVDFAWAPPAAWICLTNKDKFILRNGFYVSNPDWAPFRLPVSADCDEEIDKRRYRPSQQSLISTFTGLIAFYRYLMDEEVCLGNPAQLAKKDCRYLMKDSQVKATKRLTEAQWQFLLQCALSMANDDERYERNLFLIAALKTLFLRISELSERDDWTPSMNHFWEDEGGNWWLKVYGKGRKVRDVTVPINFLDYLKRYRKSRQLTELPNERENDPIVSKIRGRGGMTARQLSRLVQEVFDRAYQLKLQNEGPASASRFKDMTTHWLRHTGASLEIERGRALKDVSEDLGHTSMATTDTVYVRSEDMKRAESGRKRRVV